MRIILIFIAFAAVLISVAFCVQEGSVPTAVQTSFPLLLSTGIPEVKDVLDQFSETLIPQETELGSVNPQLTPDITETPLPTFTPTEQPPQNGFLVYLGLDGQLYSLDPDTNTPVYLGGGADFHVYPGSRWYSNDGEYLLSLRSAGEANEIHLVHTNGTEPTIALGAYTEAGNERMPLQPYELSPDDRFVLLVERRSDQSLVRLVELHTGSRYEIEVKSYPGSLKAAGFLGDRGRVMVVETNDADDGDILAVYAIQPNGLVREENIAAFPGRRIVQFSVSPDGLWIAVILEAPSGDRSLYILDVEAAAARELLAEQSQTIFIGDPAWTPDGNWLFVNRWFGEDNPLYELLVYDIRNGALIPVFGQETASSLGAPISFVAEVAPDNQAVVITRVDTDLEITSNWMVVLGGEYRRKMAESQVVQDIPQGEVIADVDPAWIKMLVYTSDPGIPIGSLSASSLDGQNRVALDNFVPYPYYGVGPVISPDGTMAAYFRLGGSSGGDNTGFLSVINLDGSAKKDLLQDNRSEGVTAGIPLVWLVRHP